MPGNQDNTRTIKIDMMARVEGEGAMHVTVRDGQVQDVQLRIFEPPRFFEAFLQGRHANDVPDIVARICGICPVAYQMSAVHALEPIFGVDIPQGIKDLRRLLYCGEWIESHVQESGKSTVDALRRKIGASGLGHNRRIFSGTHEERPECSERRIPLG
ncbi:MAG: nickel-dependent hydrogenase large subunit [Nitrospirales bacterium]